MRRRILGLTVLGVALTLSGCSGAFKQHEEVADAVIAQMKDFVTILESVQDPGTAQAAVTRLNDLNSKLDELQRRYHTLPGITKEQDKQIENKVKGAMQPLEDRMRKAAFNSAMKAGAQRVSFGNAVQKVLATLDKFKSTNR